MLAGKDKPTGKVEDEDEAIECHEANDGRPSISEPICQRSSDEDTDERAQLARDLFGMGTMVRGIGTLQKTAD
jgi:hypothetical protein